MTLVTLKNKLWSAREREKLATGITRDFLPIHEQSLPESHAIVIGFARKVGDDSEQIRSNLRVIILVAELFVVYG